MEPRREAAARYRCELTSAFFSALVEELGTSVALRKLRGNNAHHIVESTFKAFARAFRASLDGVELGGCASARAALEATAMLGSIGTGPANGTSRLGFRRSSAGLPLGCCETLHSEHLQLI